VESLYAADVDSVLGVLAEVDDDAHTALLIGHNPSLSQLTALLDPSAADADGLATSGIAVHTWTGEWSDCGEGTGKRVASHTARG
jgi:phosphohistidine phosphatase